MPQFSFEGTAKNYRLFLAGIAGEKWMLGFRTAILGQDPL